MSGAIGYFGGIVTNGLVLYLDAGRQDSYNRIGTTWNDLSRNGNNGTLINGPTLNSINGGVILFDGTNDYIDSNKTATQLGFYNNSYTMEAFVYPTSLSGDKVMFGTDQTNSLQGLHLVFRDGVIYQGHYGSDYFVGNVEINNWFQIVYTFNINNGNCQIFKNATLQGSGNISGFLGTTNILIGRWAGGSPYIFQGNGAIYRIYNRVLSSLEISQNYNANKSRFGL